MGRTWALASIGAAAIASAAAVGCMSNGDDGVGEAKGSATEARSDASALLKSTLLFEGGCAGVKVGKTQILTAARCVSTSQVLVKGGTLRYVLGSQGRPTAARAAKSVSPDAGGASGHTDPATTSAAYREATIADVHIHATFSSRCPEDACGLGSLVSSDAVDLAVIELDAELAAVPTIPVDLDTVSPGDPLFVTTSECALLDSQAGETVLNRTPAAPPASVLHDGSPYQEKPDLVARLAASYLVTAGPGWDEAAPGFCRTDVGGPVFRTGASVVVGVTSGLTAWTSAKDVPVTLEHTRLDAKSKEKVSTWLEGLGVETMHSCGEALGGCTSPGWDGGAPRAPGAPVAEGTGDAGLADGGATKAQRPPRPEQGDLEADTPEDRPQASPSDEDTADAGTTKKKAAKSGCSASPGESPDVMAALGALSALAAMLGRRRRRA